jgi:hypothetical protein
VWQKVFLGDAEFMQSTHGTAGCVICHGGDSSAQDKDLAHTDMVTDPSDGNYNACATCHQNIACMNENSLHTTLSGMKYALEARGGDMEAGSALTAAFENHCDECHTTCGQCHISRPTQSGGGLVSNHKVLATPSMQYNCVACHGSRVGDEYLGNNEGIPADVHWTKAGMTCSKCHTDELHGSGQAVDNRYQDAGTLQCDECHQEVWTDDIPQHQQHLSDLSCQVCHSVTYSNCYNCHVGIDQNGLTYRTSDPTEMQFKIGLNPLRSSTRPYKYVVLRHIPVSIDTFDYYGENLLPDFNALPTWKFTTPHNIQLDTTQNASCDACHNNQDLFLTQEDVSPTEREANKGVIANEIPGPK